MRKETMQTLVGLLAGVGIVIMAGVITLLVLATTYSIFLS